LTLKQLALKVGISSITLQRIEVGKSSLSVILLQIANAVDKPISAFFEEEAGSFVHIKRKTNA